MHKFEYIACSLILAASAAAQPLELPMQSRIEVEGQWRVDQQLVQWQPQETAIIVCDMWDRHWCPTATARVAEMAPRMDQLLRAARDKGILVIHAPSSVTRFYDGTPARERAKAINLIDMPNPDGWKHLDTDREAPLPIDDSDGGCDTPMPKDMVNKGVWTRQIETLYIDDHDYITDDGKTVYSILQEEGRKNLIVMGVHTNMCVLGRPFSIRANVLNGINVALMRDLTDSMYNPGMRPHVSHFRGTELVTDHIEEYWCPTILSSAIDGQPPHQFKNDSRPHAVFLLHEDEYETQRTVPAFAEEHLANKGWKCTYVFGHETHDLPGLESLHNADLMFVSVRRQVLPQKQLNMIRAFCESGKPVIGIRTASHAFAPRDDAPIPEGHAAWPEFDREILGGHYTGHYGNKDADDPKTLVSVIERFANSPMLEGINEKEWITRSWLYKTGKLQERTDTPLLMGQLVATDKRALVAWTRTTPHGNAVFYTSLGHPQDFQDSTFITLLTNAFRLLPTLTN